MADGQQISFFDIMDEQNKKKKSGSSKKKSTVSNASKTPKKAQGSAAAKPSKPKTAPVKSTKQKETQPKSAVPAKASKKPAATATQKKKPAPKAKTPAVKENPLGKNAPRSSSGHPKNSNSGRGSRPSGRNNGEKRKNNAARKPENSVRKKNRDRRSALTPIAVLFIFLLAVASAGILWRMSEYRQFQQMKAVVNSTSFYSGTTIDGIDITNMSRSDAIDYWKNTVEPKYRAISVTSDSGASMTSEELGYSSDWESVLRTVWNDANTGSLSERYARAVAGNGNSYSIRRSYYDDALVRKAVDSIAEQVDRAPVNAGVDSFDMETYEFHIDKGETGQALDREKLVSDIETALDNGGGSVSLKIDTVAQEITEADLSSDFGMISYAKTNASSSSSNRLANIKLALSLINGTCLKPGESFSFNQTVGKRTTERGFKEAPAYSSGEVTKEVGGGICQVSTTLFNAAVKADLRIDERSGHSLTVHYVDPGKDAAVDWGNKDLKFTNTSSHPVYICCYLDGEKRVRFAIFGKLLSNGVTITLEGKTIKTTDFNTEYVEAPGKAYGSQSVQQKGHKGCVAETWKIYWDANGNEINRIKMYTTRYGATTKIIAVGTG